MVFVEDMSPFDTVILRASFRIDLYWAFVSASCFSRRSITFVSTGFASSMNVFASLPCTRQLDVV